MEKIKVKARVKNYYVDLGDEIVTEPEREMPPPPVPLTLDAGQDAPGLEGWIYDHMFAMTGTGRTKGDATYDLEITESSRPDLIPVGWTYEWGY